MFLCEGELDALLLAQHGLDARSATNGTSGFQREHLPLVASADLIYGVQDQDEAGRIKAAKIGGWLGPRYRRVRWPTERTDEKHIYPKDCTELITSRGFEAFLAAVKESDGQIHH